MVSLLVLACTSAPGTSPPAVRSTDSGVVSPDPRYILRWSRQPLSTAAADGKIARGDGTPTGVHGAVGRYVPSVRRIPWDKVLVAAVVIGLLVWAALTFELAEAD